MPAERPIPVPGNPLDRQEPVLPLMVTVEEASRLLRLGERRVRLLCDQGVLDSRRVGRRRVITLSSLREYVEGGAA